MTKIFGKNFETYVYFYGSDGVLAYTPNRRPLSFAESDKYYGLGENFDGETVVIIKKGKAKDLLDYDDNGSMADFLEELDDDAYLDEDAVAVVFFDEYDAAYNSWANIAKISW